jgi:hypothetical protein
LKSKSDELVSNFAFNFNLHRYNLASAMQKAESEGRG